MNDPNRRITAWVIDKLRTDGPMSRSRLHRATAGRDRPRLDAVLLHLQRTGCIAHNDTTGWNLALGWNLAHREFSQHKYAAALAATTTAASWVPR